MKEQPVDIAVLTRMLGEREVRCELMRLHTAELEAKVIEQSEMLADQARMIDELLAEKKAADASV